MSTIKNQKSRRNFIKKSVTGIAGLSVAPWVVKADKRTVKQKMIYRKFGKTGVKLPIISMGVMNADNPNLVRAALDSGIVHLDTAHYYQRGRNEEMIGKVVKNYPRDSFFLATKVPGFHEDRKSGKLLPETKAEPFLENFETSLKRLGLEYVDILYLHSVKSRAGAMFEPLTKALEKLKKQGKIKFIGISTHKNEPEVIAAAVESGLYDVVLTAYNFKQPHREEVKKAIAFAAKAGLAIVAMKTQAGVYWDKEKQYPINMKAALKWVLQDENVHTSIPGFTTFDQLNLDLSVMEDLKFTIKEINDLKAGKKLKLAGLYCQQCGSCLPMCGHNLNIPDLMRSFMYAYGYGNYSAAKELLQENLFGSVSCNSCDQCTVKCKMGFDIKGKIIDIARLKDVPAEFLA